MSTVCFAAEEPLRKRVAARMSQYKCKSCNRAVTKSSAPDDCSGDYPWWNCCNCATVKSGWAGWKRRACAQCRQRDAEAGDAASLSAVKNEEILEQRKAEDASRAAARSKNSSVTRGEARSGGGALEATTVIAEAQEQAAKIIREAKAEADKIRTQARQVCASPPANSAACHDSTTAAPRCLRAQMLTSCIPRILYTLRSLRLSWALQEAAMIRQVR